MSVYDCHARDYSTSTERRGEGGKRSGEKRNVIDTPIGLFVPKITHVLCARRKKRESKKKGCETSNAAETEDYNMTEKQNE